MQGSSQKFAAGPSAGLGSMFRPRQFKFTRIVVAVTGLARSPTMQSGSTVNQAALLSSEQALLVQQGQPQSFVGQLKHIKSMVRY